MPVSKKQLKITKIFKKGGKLVPTQKSSAPKKQPDDCDELQEEIKQLEETLREKQNELFQIQRNKLRHKLSPLKKKDDTFIRPRDIVINNSIETMKRNLELISMLTSTEVTSYVANDHCCIEFHMQHDSPYEVKHSLQIDMKNGENVLSSSSLPLGFNINAVMDDFDNVMKPECLGAIRKALVAYYDRLEQFKLLKKMVNVEAELFKTQDGSYMEISLSIQDTADDEEEDQYHVMLLLEYRVYDIRPKNYNIKEGDLPEGAADMLREQCAVFKKKQLHTAFKEAFVKGDGQYKLIQQMGPRRVERTPRRRKPVQPHNNYNNDDTFHPEECSEQSDEDDEPS